MFTFFFNNLAFKVPIKMNCVLVCGMTIAKEKKMSHWPSSIVCRKMISHRDIYHWFWGAGVKICIPNCLTKDIRKLKFFSCFAQFINKTICKEILQNFLLRANVYVFFQGADVEISSKIRGGSNLHKYSRVGL